MNFQIAVNLRENLNLGGVLNLIGELELLRTQ